MKTAYYIQNKKEGKFINKYLKLNNKPFESGYVIKYKDRYEWSLECPDNCNDTVSVKFLMSLDNKEIERRISKLESKVEMLYDNYVRMVNKPSDWENTELTELPEKWCVKVSVDNSGELILTWFEKQLGRDISGPFGYAHYPEFERQVCTSGEIKEGYTEISFSDFESLVLKKEESKEIESGKWYKTNDSTGLFYIKEIINGNAVSYGSNKGDWRDIWTLSRHKIKELFPATTQEVEEALINEAIKRGFKKGVIINGANNNNNPRALNCKLDSDSFTLMVTSLHGYTNEKDWYNSVYNPCIFIDGKWAEIVQDNHEQIDWSIPGQKVIGNQEVIVLTSGHFDLSIDAFSGIIIDKGKSSYINGYYYNELCISNFKLYTNPVTL